MSMSERESRSRIFYGWFVVGACFVVTMSMGETMWSFGVFFKPLQAEFGWNRSLVSSGYTAFLIAYSLAAVISGRLSDRYGPRPVLLVSGLLAGLGICLCSLVQSVNEFRLFLFLAGLGAGATWAVPISTVQRWFIGRPRAGLALSIVAAGVGIGALIFAPLINYLISYHGWRNAFLISGTIFFIFIVAASPLVRQSPAEIPKGAGRHFEERSADLPTSKVLIHPSFLILLFAGSVTVIAFQILSVHLIPFSTDIGIAPTAAATAVGLMGAFSIPGRILAGPLSDRIGWKRTIAISLFGLTFASVWLFFSRSEWMLFSFAFLFGLFWGSRTTALNGAIGSFFGMRSLGELLGISSAVSNIPGAFMPYVAGYIFDVFGSYSSVFASLTLLLLVSALLTTIMKRPARVPDTRTGSETTPSF